MAYIDRDIVQEKTGKKNIKTGKEIEKGKIIGESRVIRFRDDTYSVDSKSRFAEIVDCVEFNSDAFIKALKDAILAEQKKSGISIEEAQKKQEILESEKVKKAEDYIINKQQNNIDEVRNTELIQKIQTDFPKSTEEVKAKIKKIMLDNKIPNFKNIDIPTSILEEIVSLLG
jgi:hypothetical protein